jgi:hypothetical protein
MLLEEALRLALSRGDVIVRAEPAGDEREQARAYVELEGGVGAVARKMARIGASRRPRDMSAEQLRRYRAARRRVERYTTAKPGAQRRRPPASWLRSVRRRVTRRRRGLDEELIARLLEAGGASRLRACIRISEDLRTRTFPSSGPGVGEPPFGELAPELWAAIARELRKDRPAADVLAASLYWFAFWAAYGGGGEDEEDLEDSYDAAMQATFGGVAPEIVYPPECDGVLWVKVWPADEDEPEGGEDEDE